MVEGEDVQEAKKQKTPENKDDAATPNDTAPVVVAEGKKPDESSEASKDGDVPKTDDTSSEKVEEAAGVEESTDPAAETTNDATKDKKDDAPKESSTASAAE